MPSCYLKVFRGVFFRVFGAYVRLDDDDDDGDAEAGPREGAVAAMASPNAAFPGGQREPGIDHENLV